MFPAPVPALGSLCSPQSALGDFSLSLIDLRLVSNGYPSSFVKKMTKTRKRTTGKEPTQEFKSTAVLPYIKGVSEVLCCCQQQQGMHAYAPFSNLTQHFGHTKYNLKTPLIHLNKMVLSIRFHVNAAKYISVKQGDQCVKE